MEVHYEVWNKKNKPVAEDIDGTKTDQIVAWINNIDHRHYFSTINVNSNGIIIIDTLRENKRFIKYLKKIFYATIEIGTFKDGNKVVILPFTEIKESFHRNINNINNVNNVNKVNNNLTSSLQNRLDVNNNLTSSSQNRLDVNNNLTSSLQNHLDANNNLTSSLQKRLNVNNNLTLSKESNKLVSSRAKPSSKPTILGLSSLDNSISPQQIGKRTETSPPSSPQRDTKNETLEFSRFSIRYHIYDNKSNNLHILHLSNKNKDQLQKQLSGILNIPIDVDEKLPLIYINKRLDLLERLQLLSILANIKPIKLTENRHLYLESSRIDPTAPQDIPLYAYILFKVKCTNKEYMELNEEDLINIWRGSFQRYQKQGKGDLFETFNDMVVMEHLLWNPSTQELLTKVRLYKEREGIINSYKRYLNSLIFESDIDGSHYLLY